MTTCRILVVDDEPDICRNLSDILSDLGHDVAIAHDGTQALRLIQQQRFDVALLDFKMPGMDGLTLYREIRKLRPEIVAIIVTAYATPETTESALHAGAWRVLAKPVDLQSLIMLVDEAASQPLVMIVDDDADLCASLWDVLRDGGFRVAIAHDQEDASRSLTSGAQNVVLIDLKLPRGNGAGVFRAVRTSNPKARVVLITGYRTELQEVIDLALAEGADAVCYKPFDMPVLMGTIEQLAAHGNDAMSVAAPLRILVVEDDADTRANLCDLLDLDGYEVVLAGTAAAALDRRDWASYGAILLDWKLPDASAETLLPRLRQLAPAAAVIVSTGVGGLNEAVAAIRNGATDYITKPVDPDLLRASLRRVAHERQLAADKIRSESAFRHLVEAAGTLIVILRHDGQVQYMNPAAEAATGRRLDDVRNTDCLDLCISPEQHARMTRLMQQCLTEDRPVETEQLLVSSDGSQRRVIWNIRPFGDYADEPTLLAIGTDFTARREAEDKLLQSERLAAIGKAMTGLAHESRNALQRAQANLELLALYVEGQPEARDIVQRLQATQSDLYRLYEEVRQYAAPLNIRQHPQSLQSAVREAWERLDGERQGRDATLNFTDDACDDTCRIDRFHLVQALRNILENSLAAAKDPLRITVSLREDRLQDQPAVQMAIRDNGPGIPREQQSQIFDEFFTTRQRGTGLGLAIVKRIIEAHGGQVAVSPECARGAELVITLPR